ncbi:putative ABC transporter ATP-binding protein [Melissococcus plutonius]|uniref:ABC transporter, ATP-binding protein n=1 Tax=Melissococcus plutonius (strain ATCC 35311 / DSM 29964 / CIP 104052 / LMG 20360 / NCIMB 702443) TaxID=940190 RepID=F3YCP2_MELPT|nr:putative ABC transporter ATP-binding protein [Melissococcus plutonius S1]KMT23592.1 putative ABC transporter ATP-binding protein [Melissococcus plutonius]BAK22270.1 ABC transporter, ATP-binding protein [Melissococcus plutonius ATCC 35311]KMT23644.1 putative ABC transporter ATP-binding protein [Melissococcus plutonius]KMT24279.1 putative ABC transporter ATP-binding protein [Melissococcus plutonius]
MNVIAMDKINMKFKDLVIFEDMSFKCSKNGIIGIVGENGSGKSVLFKLLAGFIIPNHGTIIINEHNITKNKLFPNKLGVLIEEPYFLTDITGFENLKLLASIKNEISDKDVLNTL